MQVQQYIAAKSGLEAALQEDAAAEHLQTALYSVFPPSALARFVTLTETEKRMKIVDLASTVLGKQALLLSGRAGLTWPERSRAG